MWSRPNEKKPANQHFENLGMHQVGVADGRGGQTLTMESLKF